jgi:hypothetical protein
VLILQITCCAICSPGSLQLPQSHATHQCHQQRKALHLAQNPTSSSQACQRQVLLLLLLLLVLLQVHCGVAAAS